MAEEDKDGFDRSFDAVADSLQPDFQQHLLDAGWPQDVASSLVLSHSNGYLQAKATDETVKKQVEDLEFGSVGTAPTGALHSYFTSNERKDTFRKETRISLGWVVRSLNKAFS